MKIFPIACALLLSIGCAKEEAPEAPSGTQPSAQSAPATGDCAPAKCADYQTACAYGRMEHLHCVPDPYAGVGSAPADQCVLVGDCTNENLPKPGTGADCDPAKCGSAPASCVEGTPTNLGCVETSGGYCTWSYRCE